MQQDQHAIEPRFLALFVVLHCLNFDSFIEQMLSIQYYYAAHCEIEVTDSCTLQLVNCNSHHRSTPQHDSVHLPMFTSLQIIATRRAFLARLSPATPQPVLHKTISSWSSPCNALSGSTPSSCSPRPITPRRSCSPRPFSPRREILGRGCLQAAAASA